MTDKTSKDDNEKILPNGMKKEQTWVVNPKPNLHLNIGGH